jgi:hypothetical protein
LRSTDNGLGFTFTFRERNPPSMQFGPQLRILLGTLLLAPQLSAGVVINEIFYHAPDDFDELQWIELYNPDPQAVDMAGWRFTRGVEYRFPASTVLPPGGFMVLSKDAKLFTEFYAMKVDGEFKKSIGRGGDTLELSDAAGRLVDRVKFGDGDPWPAAADGASASLERITPTAPGERADNWSASPLPDDRERPAGSPGRKNASYSANVPPWITHLVVTPRNPAPGQPIRVQVRVEDDDGIQAVELRYRVAKSGGVGEEVAVAMTSTDGKDFRGELPGLEGSQLVRIRVRAVDQKQSERFHPSPNALAPAVSVFVQTRPEGAGIPVTQIIHTDARELAEMDRVRQRALQSKPDPNQGGELRRLQRTLDRELDLRRAWFEWSLNRSLDTSAYRALRAVIAAKNSQRNVIMEAALAAKDPATFQAAAADRIKTFQDTLITDVKAALPGERGEAFERWYREQLKPNRPESGGFLNMLLNLESTWLALNAQFELTDSQLSELRPAFQVAARGRSDQLSALQKLMTGTGDFAAIQADLGVVEQKLGVALKQTLQLHQYRFLQNWKSSQGSFVSPRLLESRPRSPRGSAAFIYTDLATGETEVFDFIHITERKAGYKVRFHKDRPLRGMTTVNIIFETNDRFVLAEPLAFELYRRVGNAACATDFVRLTLNGQPMGYHLLFEQVSGTFLRRHGLNSDGELYKILWYSLGLEGQHERQNHPDRDHAALVSLTAALEGSSGDAQWDVIQKNFNVDQVINYFAVNMVLSHWDGFFNNYFTYHDRKGSGKWELYPWDQDKTWGFHDRSGDQVFFDMPLTFGMAGDRPPGGGPPTMNPSHWWRPGGYFSKPLLANPEFRVRFLKRTRQILEETYTEAVFFPVIDAMAARLRPEIPIRAKALEEMPEEALARLDRNVASLKEHLTKRRAFLLAQEELTKLPK